MNESKSVPVNYKMKEVPFLNECINEAWTHLDLKRKIKLIKNPSEMNENELKWIKQKDENKFLKEKNDLKKDENEI